MQQWRGCARAENVHGTEGRKIKDGGVGRPAAIPSVRILDPHLTLELKREICEKFKSLLMAQCMHRGGPHRMRVFSNLVRYVAVDNMNYIPFEECETLAGKIL